ncbi:energy-coupling factor transporter transmembrane protein EcfT [Bacillus sp. FJAT-49732]|uniref:Energy-coupling factor transporter transmembrane protein EcfT n=1 Tax=Lederbergia citrisecunda TaxID=2833583 RepID=A0A942YMJ1_9BACI|nr:energy-coupling factor transporter transmembrane component T [Lederbergia citrisecunda]MBS4199386.1 energy-coupling factor transporter transmembrane protein EcfT [Lederbergia citrisecunda]
MNKLILGRYFPGQSFLHHLDPRAKIIAGFYFIIILFLANNWQAYLLLWLFTLLVIRLSEISFLIYIRGLKPLIWLILFTVFLQILFTAGGHIYVEYGMITISQFGLMNGFYIFCRFIMIVFISTVITLTTKPIDLTDGINRLLHPLRYLKIPVDEMALMLSISLRFIPNLLDEAQKVMDAQRARGTEFGVGNVLQQMKALVPIFIPLFVSSLNRAEDLANTLEVRGYQTSKLRSSYRKLHWCSKDTNVMLIMVLLTICLVFLRLITS